MTQEYPLRRKDRYMSEDVNTRTLKVDGHTTSTAHRLVHYDGACNNIHGHNIEWSVELEVTVPEGDEKMAIDFKDVSGLLDKYDHAFIVNKDDPLLDAKYENENGDEPFHGPHSFEDIAGKVVRVQGDPTCENLTRHVAEKFVRAFDNCKEAAVSMKETDKYDMEYTATEAVNGSD